MRVRVRVRVRVGLGSHRGRHTVDDGTEAGERANLACGLQAQAVTAL